LITVLRRPLEFAKMRGPFRAPGARLGLLAERRRPAITLHGLGEVDWSSLRHAHGAADDVPGLLHGVAAGDADALYDLDDRLFHQGGFVCSAATASLPFLLDLAESTDGVDRTGVLDLVGRIAEQGREVRPRHVDPGWERAWRAAGPRLSALADDPDAKVRRTLLDVLARSASDRGRMAGMLRERWARDGDPAVRLAAVLAVGSLARGCPVVRMLPGAPLAWLEEELYDHPDPRTRLAVAIALARALPYYRVNAPYRLLPAVQDEEARIWGQAPGAGDLLADWAEVFDGMTAQMIRWADPHLTDRAEATRSCLAFLGDRDDDRRIGAVRAAAKVLSTWRSPAERLLPALAERTADRSGAVRAYATHVIAALHDGAGDRAELLAARLRDGRRLSPHGDGRIADIAAWGLALRGDVRCLPRLMERLSGPEPGFGVVVAYHSPMSYHPALPGIEEALAPLHGYAGALLPVIRDRLRDEGAGDLRRALAKVLERWGGVSAPAVAELIDLLGTTAHLVAVRALGAIGPAASAAVPSIEALLVRRPPGLSSRWAIRQSAHALPWAYWRITGDPGPALAVADSAFSSLGRRVTPRLWRYVAALGPHAAAYADRFRDLLDHRNVWTRVEAAYALHRVTEDPTEAAGALCSLVHPLTSGTYRSAGWAALRCLRDMGGASSPCHPVLRELLTDDRRHHVYGGWRAFDEDRELRELAAAILSPVPEDRTEHAPRRADGAAP
jgi:HEAT repeats